MLDFATSVGFGGVFIILLAYALNAAGKFPSDSKRYLVMNFIGCVMAAYYALELRNLPFLLLQILWGAFAAYKLLQVMGSHYNESESKERMGPLFNEHRKKKKKKRLFHHAMSAPHTALRRKT